MDKAPTPIPVYASEIVLGKSLSLKVILTSNETSTKNGRGTRRGDGRSLNDDTNDENSSVENDGIFTREDLGKETTVQSSEPSTKFED